MKIGIIGGGPAGIMTAITAAKKGHKVTILEKNNSLGNKLNITGKGRCNITYVGDDEYFLLNIVTNSKFMLSSIASFNNLDLINFLASINIKTKKERSNRVFLNSDDAKELTNRLKEELNKLKVSILYNSEVSDIEKEEKGFNIVLSNKKVLRFDKVVIASGGKSYPKTGSTGDGYIFAKKLGHKIITPVPALVPLKLTENEECKYLQGITLKNTKLKILVDGKTYDERFGELLYTANGITGPIVLSASSKINKIQNLEDKLKHNSIKIVIDTKPALDEKKLYLRLTRDFEKYINKDLKNALKDITIEKLISVVIKRTNINENKKVNEITKIEKEKIAYVLKNFEYTLKDLEKIEAGIVTSGGIDVKQIDPRTMESKIVNSLYFVGEVIDIDAYTGGFNLQIAFSTGYKCGSNI